MIVGKNIRYDLGKTLGNFFQHAFILQIIWKCSWLFICNYIRQYLHIKMHMKVDHKLIYLFDMLEKLSCRPPPFLYFRCPQITLHHNNNIDKFDDANSIIHVRLWHSDLWITRYNSNQLRVRQLALEIKLIFTID